MSPKAANEKSKPRPPEKMTFEQSIGELESIIERIEQGEVGLEQSLKEYRRGAVLLKRCREILDVAEQQIEKISPEEAPPPDPARADAAPREEDIPF